MSASPSRRLLRGVTAALLFAGCYAAIRAGLAYSPPFRFAAIRAFGGGILLVALLAMCRQPILPPRRMWPTAAVLALVGTTLGFAVMFSSPGHTGTGLASVLGNVGPLLTILLAAAWLREPLTRDKLVAFGLGIVGIVLIAWGSRWRGGHAIGLLLPLIASASGAGETVIVRRARVGNQYIQLAAWQFLVGSIPLFAISAVLEANVPTVWSSGFFGPLAFLTAGATAAATSLWYSVVSDGEVGRLSLILFLVPVAGLGLGSLLYAERFTAIQGAGVVFILSGLAVARLERPRPPTTL